jgi:hypothetical protein
MLKSQLKFDEYNCNKKALKIVSFTNSFVSKTETLSRLIFLFCGNVV